MWYFPNLRNMNEGSYLFLVWLAVNLLIFLLSFLFRRCTTEVSSTKFKRCNPITEENNKHHSGKENNENIILSYLEPMNFNILKNRRKIIDSVINEELNLAENNNLHNSIKSVYNGYPIKEIQSENRNNGDLNYIAKEELQDISCKYEGENTYNISKDFYEFDLNKIILNKEKKYETPLLNYEEPSFRFRGLSYSAEKAMQNRYFEDSFVVKTQNNLNQYSEDSQNKSENKNDQLTQEQKEGGVKLKYFSFREYVKPFKMAEAVDSLFAISYPHRHQPKGQENEKNIAPVSLRVHQPVNSNQLKINKYINQNQTEIVKYDREKPTYPKICKIDIYKNNNAIVNFKKQCSQISVEKMDEDKDHLLKFDKAGEVNKLNSYSFSCTRARGYFGYYDDWRNINSWLKEQTTVTHIASLCSTKLKSCNCKLFVYRRIKSSQ